jgi:inosine/xanthosine triphosphate pyrophosphatase family protein
MVYSVNMSEGKDRIFYVTGNPGKLASAQKVLNPYGISVEQAELKLIEPQYDSIEKIVASKVSQAYQQLGKPCIAQDSGLMIG